MVNSQVDNPQQVVLDDLDVESGNQPVNSTWKAPGKLSYFFTMLFLLNWVNIWAIGLSHRFE